MRNTGQFKWMILHVTFPLIVGGLIYICWRSQSMLMFSWFDALGFSDEVSTLRAATIDHKENFPDWFIFSVPDGAWVWSMTSCFTYLWKRVSSYESFFWICLPLILGLGGEFGQLIGFVPGTFDKMDILVMMVCAVLSHLTVKYQLKQS
jgi:hypothetical protein